MVAGDVDGDRGRLVPRGEVELRRRLRPLGVADRECGRIGARRREGERGACARQAAHEVCLELLVAGQPLAFSLKITDLDDPVVDFQFQGALPLDAAYGLLDNPAAASCG